MPEPHYHCPDLCEKPQPVRGDDGRLYCGRCWFKYGERVVMVECTPETCPDDAPPPEAAPDA